MESPNVGSNRPTPLVDAPRFLGRWRYRILMALILMVPFFVPIPRELKQDPIISGLGDRLHVILLGGTTLFLYWYGPLRGWLLRSVVAAAIIGGAIEVLQRFVGRHALWHDFFQDLIGIGIVLGFILWRGRGSRLGLALVVVLVLLVPWQMREIPRIVGAQRLCEQRFPLLGDFEQGKEHWLWSEDYNAQLHYVDDQPGHGRVQRFSATATSDYPAAMMTRFPSDWSEYEELSVDVRLVSADVDSVKGGVVLTDYLGYTQNHWIQQSYWANSQWKTVTIPIRGRTLKPNQRDLDLEDIFILKVYLSRPKSTTVLEMDNLRLR